MKAKRILVGVALVAGAAACADTPAPMLPAGPSFDGGHTLGSGTMESSTQTDTTPGRGGHTLGSGT